MKVVELRAAGGRAMVAGVPLSADVPEGRLWGLPPDLVEALQEWARVTASLRSTGGLRPDPGSADPGSADPESADPESADAVAASHRGRQLAARLSVFLAAPVDYCDPVTGHRVALRGVTRTPYPPPVPPLPSRQTGEPAVPPSAGEATPWGTGLTLTVIVAGLVLLANLALAAPMIAGLGAFGVVIDVLVVAGLAPALWLNRRAPTWRWAVYGTFAGVALGLCFLVVAVTG